MQCERRQRDHRCPWRLSHRRVLCGLRSGSLGPDEFIPVPPRKLQPSVATQTRPTLCGLRHDGLFSNNSVLCYCQGHSTDSSQRVVFDGNAVWSLGPSSQGSGFSTFSSPQVRQAVRRGIAQCHGTAPSQVLEHIYVGRSIDVGNPAATKRYESMTFDGPGGSVSSAVASLSSNGSDALPQVLTTVVPGLGAWALGAKHIGIPWCQRRCALRPRPGWPRACRCCDADG